jgi:hypothetical protein
MDGLFPVLDEAEAAIVKYNLNADQAAEFRRDMFRWWFGNYALAKTASLRGLIHKREAR